MIEWDISFDAPNTAAMHARQISVEEISKRFIQWEREEC